MIIYSRKTRVSVLWNENYIQQTKNTCAKYLFITKVQHRLVLLNDVIIINSIDVTWQTTSWIKLFLFYK